jgi:hypothetical protein
LPSTSTVLSPQLTADTPPSLAELAASASDAAAPSSVRTHVPAISSVPLPHLALLVLLHAAGNNSKRQPRFCTSLDNDPSFIRPSTQVCEAMSVDLVYDRAPDALG